MACSASGALFLSRRPAPPVAGRHLEAEQRHSQRRGDASRSPLMVQTDIPSPAHAAHRCGPKLPLASFWGALPRFHLPCTIISNLATSRPFAQGWRSIYRTRPSADSMQFAGYRVAQFVGPALVGRYFPAFCVRSIPLAMTGFSLAAASWNSSSRVDRNTELLSFFRLLNSAAIERELRSRVQMAPDFCA